MMNAEAQLKSLTTDGLKDALLVDNRKNEEGPIYLQTLYILSPKVKPNEIEHQLLFWIKL